MSELAKACKCGRRHMLPDWIRLELVGYVGGRQGRGEWRTTELRNCQCGSTIGCDVRWYPDGDTEEVAS